MELAKLNDAKKAAAIMQIRDHMEQLLEAYERTRNKTPKDTVELLAEMIGRKACLEAVANLVNIVGVIPFIIVVYRLQAKMDYSHIHRIRFYTRYWIFL